MTEKIEEFLETKICIGKKIQLKYVTLIFVLAITAIAIFARVSLFSYQSRDYELFLSNWFDTIKAAGGINGIGLSLGDYTPPYIYILALLTYIPIDSLVSIKIVSCLFDIICAILVCNMVYGQTKSENKTIIAYVIMLFAPTIILNSAYWAQCDIIFTTFLIFSINSFMKKKPFTGMIFFSLAFCFKLQAIFIAPLLILLWINKKIKFRHFLIIPAMYLLTIVPAFIAGRPLSSLLEIYMAQTTTYSEISLNAPNPLLWIANGQQNPEIASFAVALFIGVMGLMCYLCFAKKIEFDKITILRFALLCSILVPFLLPHMHERYFFIADLLAIIYVFYVPKRIFVPIVMSLASLACYSPYLFGVTPISLAITPLMTGALIAVIIYDIYKNQKMLSLLG